MGIFSEIGVTKVEVDGSSQEQLVLRKAMIKKFVISKKRRKDMLASPQIGLRISAQVGAVREPPLQQSTVFGRLLLTAYCLLLTVFCRR